MPEWQLLNPREIVDHEYFLKVKLFLNVYGIFSDIS